MDQTRASYRLAPVRLCACAPVRLCACAPVRLCACAPVCPQSLHLPHATPQPHQALLPMLSPLNGISHQRERDDHMRNLTGYWMGMLAAGAVTLAGCNKDNETGAVTSKANGETSSAPSSDAVESRDHALIRAVNAIPTKSNLTIYAGDSAAFQN